MNRKPAYAGKHIGPFRRFLSRGPRQSLVAVPAGAVLAAECAAMLLGAVGGGLEFLVGALTAAYGLWVSFLVVCFVFIARRG